MNGISMKEWQRTPMQLLAEYCKGADRRAPRYDSVRGAPGGRHRARVVLADPKRPGSERDMLFAPDQSFPDEMGARHAAALLALLHVDRTRPHERKLPEPYASAAAAAPAVGGGVCACGCGCVCVDIDGCMHVGGVSC